MKLFTALARVLTRDYSVLARQGSLRLSVGPFCPWHTPLAKFLLFSVTYERGERSAVGFRS